MNSTININCYELTSKINQLTAEKEKIEVLIEKITKDAKTLGDYWKGNSGELASGRFNKFVESYALTVKKLDSYIDFLKKVVDSYNRMDNIIKKTFDENFVGGNNGII